MKIILHGEYATLNKYTLANRNNSGYGASIKRAETNRAVMELLNQLRGETKLVPKSVFKFTWYRKNKRTDPDNICFAKKFILDAMQEVGMIENDGWNQIVGFVDKFEIDKDNPRVEIEITEAE